jgi:hypothetical protein
MSLDDVVADFLSRYQRDPTKCQLTENDIEQWSKHTEKKNYELFERIAARVALGFHKKEQPFDFDFCDTLTTSLSRHLYSGYMGPRVDDWPKLFSEVYLAFDAGEFHHQEHEPREVKPSELHTRPLIAAIVERLQT